MALTMKEVHEYCKPFLERRNFRFKKLKRLVGRRRLGELRLAKAFANPGKDESNFLSQLQGSRDSLRHPITEELKLLEKDGFVTNHERLLVLRRIQEIFLKNGIHSDFNRPSSVGLVLRTDHIGDTPVHFILGESGGSAIFCGRYYEPIDGIGSRLTVNVTSAASRLVEILDIMFNEGVDENDCLERALILKDEAYLKRWVSRIEFESDDVPVNMFLFVMSMRASIKKLHEIAGECDIPQEFVRRAINHQLDSILAHETAHMEESRSNGSIPLSKPAKEFIAYLIEAAYASPDIAFRSMLYRRMDLEKMMPGMFSDLREMGGMALLEGPEFLKECALESLDEIFIELSGKNHDEVVLIKKIEAVQTSDYMTGGHMPLVERSMCNPSLR